MDEETFKKKHKGKLCCFCDKPIAKKEVKFEQHG